MELYPTNYSQSSTVSSKENKNKDEAIPLARVDLISHGIFQEINQSYFDRTLIEKLENFLKIDTNHSTTTQSTQSVAQHILKSNQEEKAKVLQEQLNPVVNALVKAQQLLNCALTETISPEELVSAADALIGGFASSIQDIPIIAVIAHQLYDKASEKLIESKNIERAFKIRLQAAQIPFSRTHPLYKMEEAIRAASAQQSDSHLGAYFSSFDTSVVKGGNLQFFSRNIEGTEKHCLYFDINPFARKDLQQTIDILKDPEKISWLIKEGFCEDIKMTRKNYAFMGEDKGIYSEKRGLEVEGAKALEINFKGIGKVMIGESPKWTFFNTVYVEIDKDQTPGEGLKKIHYILSLLGLGPVLGPQKQENDRRMQMAQLFRAHFPQQSYIWEQTRVFFELPISELRKQIENEVPEMKGIFKTYLDDHPELMKKEEIYPGKTIWTVTDLSEKMKEKGAWGLMAGIEGSMKDGIETACLILMNGLLSSEDRFKAGLNLHGASSFEDLKLGGGRGVFTRAVTLSLQSCKSQMVFHGHIQVLYDLDAVNRVSYGYHTDKYGSKMPQTYSQRSTLPALAERLSNIPSPNVDNGINNEILVKNRIRPDLIRGFIIVDSYRDELIKAFRDRGLIKVNKEGKECINGKLLRKFIYSDLHFKKEMWYK